MPRVRVVEGTCWPCKKRRTRCDLAKPICQRCQQTGAQCDYSSKLIRWSARPSVRVDAVPAPYRLSGLGQDGLASSEKLALDYFHGRVWPLLQASEDVCPPPLPVALENRVVLLATCVLAGSHRRLQQGDGSAVTHRGSELYVTRMECLAAIKSEVDFRCAGSCKRDLLVLLFAVLLLHLHDGFMEPEEADASTASHHQGVSAILTQLGGLEHVLRTGPKPMQMLLAEFASADLTTAMLQGTAPSFPTSIWQTVDEGNVWWARDPYGRQSLASVLREMTALAFYHDSVANGLVELSMNHVRAFEEILSPVYTPLTPQSLREDGRDSLSASPASSKPDSNDDTDAVHAFALVRSFQHAALIFLYRAVCGLPTGNPLVQQHVQPCLNCISEIERPSKVLHCVIFPLFVAGAHAQSARHQQAVVDLLGHIHNSMRFASVRAVADYLGRIWDGGGEDTGWVDMFGGLGRHVLVL